MENTDSNTENIIENKLDSKDRSYSTGRRKNSIARVWIKRGNGGIKMYYKLKNTMRLWPL